MSAPEKHPPRDLAGTWRVAPADEDLRRRYQEPSFDDSSWEQAEVPGQWRSAPGLSASGGPVLYRHRFETAPLGPGERAWMVLDGVFHSGDVWLDGTYVGDAEGYFFPHSFEVTELVGGTESSGEHVVALEVTSNAPAEQRSRSGLARLLEQRDVWDPLGTGANPGGIWRSVLLERTGPVRISQLRAICRDAGAPSATIALHAAMEADTSRQVELRTILIAPDGRELLELTRDQHLAAGPNHIEWQVTVPDPDLWWPWSLGDQPLYVVRVEVIHEGAASDARQRSVGLRKLALRNWQLWVNGERFVPKGSNLAPASPGPGPTADEAAARMEAAQRQGIDLLRISGYVPGPELYTSADSAGVLLWQDLPLQWGVSRGVRRKARREVAEAVDVLGHHACIAVWGNVVNLDRSISRLLSRNDGSRPVVAHADLLPSSPTFDGSDRRGRGGRLVGTGGLLAVLGTSRLRPGGRLDLEIHVVNHRDISFPDIVLNVDLYWRREDGELVNHERRAWQGQLPAKASMLAATVDSVAPAGARSLACEMQLVDPSRGVVGTGSWARELDQPIAPMRWWASVRN